MGVSSLSVSDSDRNIEQNQLLLHQDEKRNVEYCIVEKLEYFCINMGIILYLCHNSFYFHLRVIPFNLYEP